MHELAVACDQACVPFLLFVINALLVCMAGPFLMSLWITRRLLGIISLGLKEWATDGARTRNSQNHNLELYH